MLRERMVDDVIILTAHRVVKGAMEAALRARLDSLVAQGHLQILIDMKELPYLDSSEIGRLIRCHLSIRQAGGRVRLFNISARVMTQMKMTRLDTVLDLFTTEEAALAAFRREDHQDTRQ
jgi:anti-sigma B factor antagonist